MRIFLTAIAVFWSLASSAEPIYKEKDKIVDGKDLPPALRQQLYDVEKQRYQGLKRVFEEKIFSDYIEEQRGSSKLTTEEMRSKLLEVADPTTKELKKFYDDNKSMIPYSFETVQFELKEKLRLEKQFLKKQDVIRSIMAKKKITFVVPEPAAPSFDINLPLASPSKGEKAATVTLVEFGDYKCPYCAKAHPILEKISKKYNKKMRFVYVDFFPQAGGISEHLARGAYCANRLGKFWEYHSEAYSTQATTSYDFPVNFAKKHKMDVTAFEQCLSAPETIQYVVTARAEGQRLGVAKTPGLYLNGTLVSLDDGEDELEAKIKKLL